MVKYPEDIGLQKRIDSLVEFVKSAEKEIIETKENIKKAKFEILKLKKIVGEKICKTKQ